MRFIIGLLITLFACAGLSAGNNRTLTWFTDLSSGTAMPNFKESVHTGGLILPWYSETQKPSIAAKAYTVRLIYPEYQKLSATELRQILSCLGEIPDSIQVRQVLSTERKSPVLTLSFCPFVRKGGSYYKLNAFGWDIRPVENALRSASTSAEKAVLNSNSVLATGKWKKISVPETGLYKLTYADIKGMGINPDLVQVYGYGGALLEEDFSQGGYKDDLPEVSVWKDLGDDGVFNAGDFILFYAQGPVSWKYNRTSDLFARTRNHYSDKAYYLVGERSQGTKTVATSTFEGTPTVEVNSYTEHLLHESELANMGELVAGSGTGRQLYGEDFTYTASQTFNFDILNPDTTQTSKARVDFVARNTGLSSCAVYAYNGLLTSLSISPISDSNDYTYANLASKVVQFKPSGKTVSIRLAYQKNGNSIKHRACLDFISLNLRCFLKMSGSSLTFRDPRSVGEGQVGRFTIGNATGKPVVFDVTDPGEMLRMNGEQVGTDYAFKASTSSLREYVCADLTAKYPRPTIVGNVPNQNIHGHSRVDMIILAPDEFLPYANQLAKAHASHDDLNVLVVTPEQAYNEFSSGTPDATAYRRMMKYFYDKATTEADLPKHLLLFGDGVYDNRLLTPTFKNQSIPNRLLTYESAESLEGSVSYVSDDYFGFLDDNEGANLESDMLDIGVGRFPVSTKEQAEIAVEKTIAYMENARKGVWKNRLLFLADDPGVKKEYVHQEQADALANTVSITHPEFMVNKIYVDAYPKVTTASGTTVPDANNRFSELLNSGLLLVNYTGHGSTTQWAEEKLLTMPEIKTMTNKCLPLWVTATCDYTRYDAPETSAGESIFLNPNGGGIALFSTTRVVYSTNNSWLNTSFIDNIFTKKAGVRYTLGEIMMNSKRSLSDDSNKLKFTLIGDPALKLAYPEYSAKVTRVNGTDVSETIDTLHALSKVTVSGNIYREDGTLADDFNGVICPSVLDAENILMQWPAGEGNQTFFERSKVLFSGKDSVQNGRFSFSFIVPKDISYSDKAGYINLYAYDDKSKNEAQGYYEQFVLTGSESSGENDENGPGIQLYLNDTNFVEGGAVNETPTLIARISDKNGLNTSGNGIGHDLMLIVDGLPSMTFKTNNYYVSDIGSYTSGVVQFVLPVLSAGKHQLTFKAWDVLNNSSVDTLRFEVKPGKSPLVSDLKFAQKGDDAYFLFSHDRPEINVKVNLTIYDLMGRELWNSEKKMQSSENVSETLGWNLTDTNGARVPNGIYICKIMLTDSNGAQTVGSQKIRVAAQ